MSLIVYKSTDASAPTLSGTAGDLTNLLKKCLVDGYGSKAAAGWTSPYIGTANQRVFRPGSGVQHYFAIDDDSPDVTAAAKEAQLRGYEVLTGWAAGIAGAFPTTVQQAESGVAIRKSAAASGTTRTWMVVADDRTCWLFIISGDSAGVYTACGFGEFFSLLTVADSYRSMVIGRPNVNSSSMITPNEVADMLNAVNAAGTAGHYVPRVYTGLGTAASFKKWTDAARSASATSLGSGGLATPEPVTGAIHVAPIHLSDGATASVRGRLRGLYNICHPSAAFADGDTITGSGAYAGRTFLVIKAAGNTGSYCVDITGAWETN